ncbi:larval cuticle protein 1-like [Eurosta solidaginis]|uniref:larval cuticle protein 1-like n=1 Tax=Eurosta solidaginis TaxID=178769 RepID=UPI0035313638
MVKCCIFLLICVSIFVLTNSVAIKDRPLISKSVINPATVTAAKTAEPVKDHVEILKSVAERKDDGSYVFSYEGADGNYREEVGIVKNAGTDDEKLEVSGSYRYYDREGQLIEVHYTADENGYVPQGTNILPAISEAAKAAVEFARSQPAQVK